MLLIFRIFDTLIDEIYLMVIWFYVLSLLYFFSVAEYVLKFIHHPLMLWYLVFGDLNSSWISWFFFFFLTLNSLGVSQVLGPVVSYGWIIKRIGIQIILTTSRYYLPEAIPGVKNLHKTWSLSLRLLIIVLVMIKKICLQRYRHTVFISRFSFFTYKPFTKNDN